VSQINTEHTGLILISGVDAPGVTQALFAALDPFSITILDIEQVVIRGRLILTTLISLDPAHAQAIETDLLDATSKLGLDLAIDFSDQPKGESRNSNLHIIVLSENLRPAGIGALASKIAEQGGNIDRIHRTASYPLTAIEFEVSLNLDDDKLKIVQRELCGVGAEVAAITQAAMRGELDFTESLTARVKLLAGANAEILDSVKTSITLTPGARTLIRTLHKLGHKVGVVSGGFLDVIEPLLNELEIDFYRANKLEITDGKLTGSVLGSIVDKNGKALALREFASAENVNLSQTIAIGDGANDLGMLELAGLGIAFNAKPAVRAAANSSINSPYLDSVLYLMGITRNQIEDADRNN